MSSTETSPSPEQPAAEQNSAQDTNGANQSGGASQGGSAHTGTSLISGIDLNAIIERCRKIITDPIGTWPEIRDEATTIESIYKNYLVYLAAIPAVAMFLGHIFKRNVFGNLFSNLLTYALILGMVYIGAMIIEFLAPKFEGGASRTESFKLLAYSMTPAMLGGVFNLIPILSIIGALAGLYGAYLFYLGIEPLVRVSGSKRIGFILAFVGCSIIINLALFLVFALAS